MVRVFCVNVVYSLGCKEVLVTAQKKGAPVIPDHRILRRIDAGSFGEVWLARSLTGVFRAVKVVPIKPSDSTDRARIEFQGLAAFEPLSRNHEGFVQILHVGRDRETLYYIMEIGDDLKSSDSSFDPQEYCPRTLATVLELKESLSAGECVDVGMRIAGALDMLHHAGKVHRDIKPANVIFVGGKAKLADVGLVAQITPQGQFLGSLGYIPPEGQGTPQGDVFSLGRVLYECFTGNSCSQFPVLSPRCLEGTPQTALRALNQVILKACAEDPSDRYPSAGEFQAALLEVSRTLSQAQFESAHPRKSWPLFLVVGAVASLSLLAFHWSTGLAKPSASMESGGRVDRQGSVPLCLRQHAEAIGTERENASLKLNDRLALITFLETIPKPVDLCYMANQTVGVGFAGQDLATVGSIEENSRPLVELKIGSKALRLHVSNHPTRCWLSPESKTLLTWSEVGNPECWDARTCHKLELTAAGWASLAQKAPSTRILGLSTDGGRWIAAGIDQAVSLISSDSATPIVGPFPHPSPVACAALSPDQRRMATACSDRLVRLWDITTGKELSASLKLENPISFLEFNYDGRYLLTGGGAHEARLWELDRQSQLQPVVVFPLEGPLLGGAFSRTGDRLALAGKNGFVCVWDLTSLRTGSRGMSPTRRIAGSDQQAPNYPPRQTQSPSTSRAWNSPNGEYRATTQGASLNISPNGASLEFCHGGFSTNQLKLDSQESIGNSELRAMALVLAQVWGGGMECTPPQLISEWHQLESARQALFPTCCAQARQWHREEVDKAEADQNWFSALFHIKCLMALDPSDQSLTDRKTQLEVLQQQARRGV
jgi:serine/threonine protein kinase